MVLAQRWLMVVVLVAAHAFLSWLLTLESKSAEHDAEGDVVLAAGQALPNDRWYQVAEKVTLDSTVVKVPFFEDPLVGFRLLDPTLFLRSVVVDLDLRTVPKSNDARCNEATGAICGTADKEDLHCDPANVQIAVEYESSLNRFGRLFPGNDGAAKIFSYLAPVIPSVKACVFESSTHFCNMEPQAQSNVSALDNAWFVCDNDCHCELGLPALPQVRFALKKGIAPSESLADEIPLSEVHVARVALSPFPPMRLPVFLLALAVYVFSEKISENRLFQIILSFCLGVVVLSLLFLVFVYNMLQKGANQFPGLEFLRNINRAGPTAGVIGFTSIYFLAQTILGFLDERTLCIPITGWSEGNCLETHVPIKWVLVAILGVFGVGFQWKFGIFQKIQVEEDEDQTVSDDPDSPWIENDVTVRRRWKDSNSLMVLKLAVSTLSATGILWCWNDMLAPICLYVAFSAARVLHRAAEHASHIPSHKAMKDMHGGFQDPNTLRIVGRGAFRGDSTPADKLVKTPIVERVRWEMSAEAAAFQEEQIEELKATFQRYPELIGRCKNSSQTAIRSMLDGGSHLGPPQPEQPKRGCCARCCTTFKRWSIIVLTWLAAITVLILLAEMLL